MQRLTAHRRRPDQLRSERRPRLCGRVGRYIYCGLLGLFVLALANVTIGALLVLKGDGIVTRPAQVVTAPYAGTITRVAAQDGAQLAPGARIATIPSQTLGTRLDELEDVNAA